MIDNETNLFTALSQCVVSWLILELPLFHVSNCPNAESLRSAESNPALFVPRCSGKFRTCWCGHVWPTLKIQLFRVTSRHVCLFIPVPSIRNHMKSPKMSFPHRRTCRICMNLHFQPVWPIHCEDTERPCAAPRSSGDREGGTPLRGKHGGAVKVGTTSLDRKICWHVVKPWKTTVKSGQPSRNQSGSLSKCRLDRCTWRIIGTSTCLFYDLYWNYNLVISPF